MKAMKPVAHFPPIFEDKYFFLFRFVSFQPFQHGYPAGTAVIKNVVEKLPVGPFRAVIRHGRPGTTVVADPSFDHSPEAGEGAEIQENNSVGRFGPYIQGPGIISVHNPTVFCN